MIRHIPTKPIVVMAALTSFARSSDGTSLNFCNLSDLVIPFCKIGEFGVEGRN
jgi:hypothetical protein